MRCFRPHYESSCVLSACIVGDHLLFKLQQVQALPHQLASGPPQDSATHRERNKTPLDVLRFKLALPSPKYTSFFFVQLAPGRLGAG